MTHDRQVRFQHRTAAGSLRTFTRTLIILLSTQHHPSAFTDREVALIGFSSKARCGLGGIGLHLHSPFVRSYRDIKDIDVRIDDDENWTRVCFVRVSRRQGVEYLPLQGASQSTPHAKYERIAHLTSHRGGVLPGHPDGAVDCRSFGKLVPQHWWH